LLILHLVISRLAYSQQARSLGRRLPKQWQAFEDTLQDDGGVVGFSGKNLSHHGREERQGLGAVVGIEGRLIPALTKIDAGSVIRAVLEFLTLELVPAIVMSVIDHLESTMMLDRPYDLFAQERAKMPRRGGFQSTFTLH
jgi:hypothetical protein